MANWGKLITRGNVEDRRSLAPAVTGIGVGGMALLIVFNLLTGGTAEDVLGQLDSRPIHEQSIESTEFEGDDSYEVFASKVLGSNNDMWTQIFSDSGKTYTPPKLVLFRTVTESLCGNASSRVGPHYCPLDKTIYLDETFFEELTNRFGAAGGDVAEAYVISHEVGHHVQNELGLIQRVLDSGSREDSINLELQSDCFAGLWANSIGHLGVFEQGEIHEAMDAAAAVGDDRIQEKINGYVNPESWTHGSSEERVKWFDAGYKSGSVSSCNIL